VIEILKSNGDVVELNQQQILQKNLNPYSKQMNIYSGSSWILTGELPSLEIGDIIHTKQTRTILKARMENNFFDQISVDNYSPKLLQTYQLKMPSNLELYIHHINKKENYVQFKQNKDGNFTVYEWQVESPPQIIYEPGMENLDRFGYNIVLTTIKKWEEVSRWYYSLVEPHLKPNDAIREKVEELTADTDSKLEKIKNIFYWVAQKIRYLGVDKEEYRPGYEPHDVDYTFETRGGVCRDKSALLVSMFRLAGIEADPILISVGYQLYDKAPLVWFNHAIVVSYDEEGKPEYFFDPTDENTKDFLPQYEEDCSYIIASKKGDVLRTVPVSSSERNKTKVNLAIEVDENSQANCNLSISYSGMADNIMRSSLMQMTPKRKQDRIENMVSQIHPQAKLENYAISEPQNRNININLSCSFSIPKYIEISEDYTFIPLEAGKFSISFLHEYILQVFNLNNRKYPFKLPMTYSIEFTEKLTLPENITTMSFPELPSIDFQNINLLSTRNIKSNYVEYTCKFAIDKIHFEKKDYLPLKREISKLNSLDKLFLIGEK
ncbi:MAG: transglutaminase domain-containing protein, partial [Candidatus Cloacimonadota bacterium]|nr:transglutaminase domain-containing protein [Candidatus Cloacimonadota bacterium]